MSSPDIAKMADLAVGAPVEFAKKKKKKKRKEPEKFDDLYELTGVELGRGASAVVLECRGRLDNTLYAVKMLDKQSPDVRRQQVFRELDILTDCQNQPQVLQLIKFYETDEDFKFVFEKANGGALFEHIQNRASFTELEASRVTRDIARALLHLHQMGIAHRDLKPQNILCMRKDQAYPAKLCDFNLGSEKDEEGTGLPMMTPVGTPEYMAPELAEAITAGEQRVYDKRCDVWSLGVIIYMMLSGTPPFFGDCGFDCGWKRGENCEDCADNLFEAIQEGHFEFPPEAWLRVSGAAKDLIARCLVRESQRISAEEVLMHPWIRQDPPATPLLTPKVLRGSVNHLSQLDTFSQAANKQNRKVDTGLALGPLLSSDLYRRRQGAKHVVASSFHSIKGRDLEDVRTPQIIGSAGSGGSGAGHGRHRRRHRHKARQPKPPSCA